MVQISVVNESTSFADADVQKLLPIFDKQWNGDLKRVWSVDQAQFAFFRGGTPVPAGSWWLLFVDDTDRADDRAYHDLTTDGLPLSKVFVQTILKDKVSVSVAATHEMCEMAVDPWLNMAFQDPQGSLWAAEICDPVQGDQYGYKIDGTLVTDFVTPAWFGCGKGRMDVGGHVMSPFEVLTGGYAQQHSSQDGKWHQTVGPMAMRRSMAASPVSGSRRERRARQAQEQMFRSQPVWK